MKIKVTNSFAKSFQVLICLFSLHLIEGCGSEKIQQSGVTSCKNSLFELCQDQRSSDKARKTNDALFSIIGITNCLDGYSRISKLKKIDPQNESLEDLSPLGVFNTLRFIELSHNQIEDLAPFRGLLNLQSSPPIVKI